jgi:hypothetical protein
MLASESVALDMLGFRHGARRGAGRVFIDDKAALRATMRRNDPAHAVHF